MFSLIKIINTYSIYLDISELCSWTHMIIVLDMGDIETRARYSLKYENCDII